jgi:hypothetical protein
MAAEKKRFSQKFATNCGTTAPPLSAAVVARPDMVRRSSAQVRRSEFSREWPITQLTSPAEVRGGCYPFVEAPSKAAGFILSRAGVLALRALALFALKSVTGSIALAPPSALDPSAHRLIPCQVPALTEGESECKPSSCKSIQPPGRAYTLIRVTSRCNGDHATPPGSLTRAFVSQKPSPSGSYCSQTVSFTSFGKWSRE